MPHSAILPAMTMDDRIRNDVLSKGAGCCALMFTVASTFSEQLVAVFGSYRTLMCLYAVLAIVSFWGLFRTSEERYVKASVGEASAVLSFYENLIDEMGGSPYPLRWEKGVYPAGDNIADAIRAETLYVAEDGGGIVGKALLQFAAGCCRADGSRVLRLDTLPWNLPGKRLYEGFGFQYRGDVEVYYPSTGQIAFSMYELVL